MRQKGLTIIVLAAGKGTRMKSSLAKALQPLSGKPLLQFVLETADTLSPGRVIVVVGFQADSVKKAFPDPSVEFVEQKEQLGTGHAVQQAEPLLRESGDDVLILCGDMPLVRSETLKSLIRKHRETGAQCTLLTLKSREVKDFGRILRNEHQSILRIVESKDATEEEKKVDEFNAGVYCFDKGLLFKALSATDNRNAQKEYYLTDTIEYLVRNHIEVQSVRTEDAAEIFGINSREDLEKAERLLQDRKRSV